MELPCPCASLPPPHWMLDALLEQCSTCGDPFTLINRRHHCRCCGALFCGDCASNVTPLPGFGIEAPVRTCDDCHTFETRQLPLLLAGDLFIKPGVWTGARNVRYVWLSADQARLCWAPWVDASHEAGVKIDAHADDNQAKQLPLASLLRVEEGERPGQARATHPALRALRTHGAAAIDRPAVACAS